MSALLQTTGLEAGYGGVQVLWGVDLDVQENETVVLLGPNGAGKTTLLKCLMGLLPTRGGSIQFRGQDISRLPSRARVRLGLSYMSELAVFSDLTVDENIDLGALFVDRAIARRRRDELYALFPILLEKKRQAAGGLSGGQRKMLGVAKALAAEPKLLVMDEPSAGLSPLLVSTVIKSLAQCRSGGLSLLIAEQNVKFLELGDRVFTMEGGRIAFGGTPAAIQADDGLRRAYFGLGV
ncbi:ABC transporter ATP-binding protein [Acidisphaera sp. L21]|uniref:ABC transporter ATP-binding protein n=1 Tax=Acidisphaera sp. L21 TaxID=1641851 RepID=UPI00131DC8E0|nr:ABC transporter ATP-binding protein [Acidisphaera sp. L21]